MNGPYGLRYLHIWSITFFFNSDNPLNIFYFVAYSSLTDIKEHFYAYLFILKSLITFFVILIFFINQMGHTISTLYTNTVKLSIVDPNFIIIASDNHHGHHISDSHDVTSHLFQNQFRNFLYDLKY